MKKIISSIVILVALVATMSACEKTLIYTPNGDVKANESFVEVVKDDVRYVVSSDLSKAFIWNSDHSYFPDMDVSYDAQDIPESLLEGAENYFDVTEK